MTVSELHDANTVIQMLIRDYLGWRGRNERTGLEGIFPRSYVNIIEEKTPLPPRQPTQYGNMPLDVAQSGSSMTTVDGKKPSKFEENGKKFGKKMGNAGMSLPCTTMIGQR